MLTKPYGNFNVTFYDELADAFMAGQMHLLRDPPPEMMALPEPRDATANRQFRLAPEVPGRRFAGLHDLSLYDGKLYLEWGPLPALLLIPSRWIVGHDLPMGYVVLTIATIAALVYAASVLKLARLSGLSRTPLLDLLTVVLFILCPIWMLTLHRIAVYEIAVFFAQLCVSISLFCIVTAFDRKRVDSNGSLWLLGFSGLFLGLAVNCRLNLASLGLIVPIILYIWWKSYRHPPAFTKMITPMLTFGGPAALLLFCALIYNKIRFGSFFEAGMTWQLTGLHVNPILDKFKSLSLNRIIPNIWYYFFAPITNLPGNPVIILPKTFPPDDWMPQYLLSGYDFYAERTCGLFVAMPMTALISYLPISFFWRSKNLYINRAYWIELLLLLSGILSGSLLFLAPATIRYSAEWCMWWMMAGTLACLQVRANLRALAGRTASILFDTGLFCATLWSGWVAICFLGLGG